jgi:tetratricopeptide (TPR) repeat protein
MKDPSNRIADFWRVGKPREGAMGEVWRAWDVNVGRWVALKLLKSHADPARMQREASAAAALKHPNIATIFSFGEHQGRFYIAMEFVHGRTLKEVSFEDPKDLIRVVREAALAISAAHDQKVIHRDLKPDNILVDQAGDPPRWRVHVVDFGLAKKLDIESDLSLTTEFIGTPHYMSPEQALGKVDRIDERSDLYGLGATLYKLSTGRAPFDGEDPFAVIRKIREEELPSPRSIDPKIDRDLERIITKAMRREKRDRYQNASELIEDLDAYLAGEPLVHAKRDVFGSRVFRAVRKHKGLLGAVLGVLFLISTTAFYFTRMLAREEAWSSYYRQGKASFDEAFRLSTIRDFTGAKTHFDQAAHFLRLANATKNRPEGYLLLARCELFEGRADEAIPLWQRALQLDPSSAEARAYLGQVEGAVEPAIDIEFQAHELLVGGNPQQLALADLNHDGNPDIAVTNFLGNDVSVFVSDPDGHYGPERRVGEGIRRPNGIVAGDFDGDGHPDLAVTNYDQGTVTILLGDGKGNFKRKDAELRVGATPTALVAADFDRDGRLDLAVVNMSEGSVSIRLGLGDGAFEEGPTIPVGNAPYGIAVGDLNGDGLLDLVVGTSGGDFVSVLLGKGDGTFTSPLHCPAGPRPGGVALGDLDGDGKLDLVVASHSGDTISVLLGKGDGTFGAPRSYPVGISPITVAIADFGGSGMKDVVVPCTCSDVVCVLRGIGAGRLGRPQFFKTGAVPHDVVIADMNRDHVPDMVIVNHGSGTVSIFECVRKKRRH